MRIVYYSQSFFADCDFPLIRELQQKGVDIRYFMPMPSGRKKQSIIDIKNLKEWFGVYKASDYPEFSIYKDYIDLDKIFLLNIPDGKRRFFYKLYWKWFFLKIWLMKSDVFHFTWQLGNTDENEKIFYKLPCKKTMTVHDPLSHSSVVSELEEQQRVQAFDNSSHFMLLSDVLANDFCMKYTVNKTAVSCSHMGEFSHLRYIKTSQIEYKYPYILFFGQISSYKGVEYLCEAMVMIHKKHPDVHLVIAGRGEIYFDYMQYEKLEYIHLKNEYLSISDISTLLNNSLFAVCPYKDATQSGVVQTAFSCNTPMIVTNVGALPKAVQDGVTGLVVSPCNSEELAGAMDKILSNPLMLTTFRDNIEKVWRPTMDWEEIADKYIEMWKESIKK